ncbi:collagenase-like [Malaya genurostris]|uniref:collagenase-like n=1 Tax=Malaya genurostris TaxID=325434 RepID=UPI0026F3E5D7|nr:collagenase-like [Malaya genurostris]
MFKLTIVIVAFLAIDSASPAELPSRIVNGEAAVVGQFPYQVLLKIQLSQGRALCGGSLLSDQWILTAGHCVQGASSFEVTLGALDLVDNGNDGRVVLTATEYIRHDRYNPLFAVNDIAVIKLPTPIVLSDRIQPIKLPTNSDKFTGQKVVVSGWGLQKNGGNVAEKLQFAPLKVITNLECMRTYSPIVIRKSTLCARGEAKQSPCNGDSGGPLVLEGTNVLVGVVSFGHATGCELGSPAAFARVTSFADWIRKTTGL